MTPTDDERKRRWRLVLGAPADELGARLTETDLGMDRVLEALYASLHLELRVQPGSHPLLHPGKAARADAGWLGELHPARQRDATRVLVSAFLEATLKGVTEYLPVFADVRTAGAWLPEAVYINQYQDLPAGLNRAEIFQALQVPQ